MFIPMRVGDSFVADVNNFAQAVIYGVDNGALVIQEALGTLNHTHARRARRSTTPTTHGVAVIASAADEAAQHHNWPSNYAHTIVVNSITKYDTFTPGRATSSSTAAPTSPRRSRSRSRARAAPRTRPASGSGLAGLIYSAALNARDAGDLDDAPELRAGQRRPVRAERQRGAPAHGLGHDRRTSSRSTTSTSRRSRRPRATRCRCRAAPTRTGCSPTRPPTAPWSRRSPRSKSYPARKGFDEFYGYGRVNMVKGIEAVDAGTIPPEAEITSPRVVRARRPDAGDRHGARPTSTRAGSAYTCQVYVAPGSEPNNGCTTDLPPGDFELVSSNWCDGATHTSRVRRRARRTLDVARPEVPVPGDRGRLQRPRAVARARRTSTAARTPSHTGSSCGVVVTTEHDGMALTGQDRRNMYLHRDQDMLPGFPKYAAERRRVLAGARRPRRRQPQRAGLRHLGRIRARDAPRRHRAVRLAQPLATRCRCTPAGARSRAARSTRLRLTCGDPRLHGASPTSTATARPRWSRPT